MQGPCYSEVYFCNNSILQVGFRLGGHVRKAPFLSLSPVYPENQVPLPRFSGLCRFVGVMGNARPVFLFLLSFGLQFRLHGLLCGSPPLSPSNHDVQMVSGLGSRERVLLWERPQRCWAGPRQPLSFLIVLTKPIAVGRRWNSQPSRLGADAVLELNVTGAVSHHMKPAVP